MSKSTLMDTLRSASSTNKTRKVVETISCEDIDEQINVALEQINNLYGAYENVRNFSNTIVGVENADYSEIIHKSAIGIINRAVNTASLKGDDSFALEAMSFNMAGIIDNVKNTGIAIWKKICDWINKLLVSFDQYLINYRNGLNIMANHLISMGNDVVKGKLVESKQMVEINTIDFKIGTCDGVNVANEFLSLKSKYDKLVNVPLTSSAEYMEQLIQLIAHESFSLTGYERDVRNAVRSIFREFMYGQKIGVDPADVKKGSKFTDKIAFGAVMQATRLEKIDSVSLTGVVSVYDCEINTVIVKSPNNDDQVYPISGLNMIKIGSDIKDKNNPWINNKNGGVYLRLGERLLAELKKAGTGFQNDEAIDMLKSFITTFSSCVIGYNKAAHDVYKYAATATYYIAKASVSKP